jgi:hypothetical protein
MKDCTGRTLVPLTPEPPHDNAFVQCAICLRLRSFTDGQYRWLPRRVVPPSTQIDGWVICPSCRT